MTRAALLVALVAVSGCLPGSERRRDRSLPASDSASVALAATVPVDSLTLVWQLAPEAEMPLPTGIAWVGPALVVVETREAMLHRLTADGRWTNSQPTGGGPESYPYLAGVRGDTLALFERGADRIAFVPLAGGTPRRIPVPAGATAAVADSGRVAVRTGGGTTDEPGALLTLAESGRVLGRHPLRGRPFRATGFLRAWGPRTLALSGYRPVVDVLRLGTPDGQPADTLALGGFASPELVRSAQFLRGDARQPPLLTSSAVALGDRLLVLNLRPDRVRIDVYDARGRLVRVLESAAGPPATLFPFDFAVREVGGVVEIALLMQRPSGLLQSAESRVDLYRWAAARMEPS